MDYLKINSKGFETYNGTLNIITFKNGVSTEPVPPRIADRIAAAISVVACDENGDTGETLTHIGVQHRLIDESVNRAPVLKGLARQSDADRVMEQRVDLSKALQAPSETLYTKTELETLADKSGIKGLRDIGKNWKVTGRAIPELIEKILVAQTKFLKQRDAALETRKPNANRVTTIEAEQTPAPVVEEVLTAAGIEGLADAYTAGPSGAPVVTGAQLIDRALKNSGKSLTGWNKLTDTERKPFIDREIDALEIFYSARLTPVLAAEEKKVEEKPAEEPKIVQAVVPPVVVTETKPEDVKEVAEGEGSIEPPFSEDGADQDKVEDDAKPEDEAKEEAPADESKDETPADDGEDEVSEADEDDDVDFIDEDGEKDA